MSPPKSGPLATTLPADTLEDPSTQTLDSNEAKSATLQIQKTNLMARLRSDRLYGREQEVSLLQQAFESSWQQRTKRKIIIISAPEGVGKTKLALTLKDSIQAQNGYFVAGKFDSGPEPYAAFVSAFCSFTHQVIERGELERQKLSEAVKKAVGTRGIQNLRTIIPCMDLLLGPFEAEESYSSQSSLNQRFIFAFNTFITALCSEVPILLLLDDLHNADRCSLDLLGLVVAETSITNLVLVGTCDPSRDPNSYVQSRLAEMQDKGDAEIVDISLNNLDRTIVDSMLNSLLNSDTDENGTLTDFVMKSTCGNPMLIAELLDCLFEEEIVFFNQNSVRWELDEGEMASIDAENLAKELAQRRINNLSEASRDVLKAASCLWSESDLQKLGILFGETSTASSLDELVTSRLLNYNPIAGTYSFTHDYFKSTAYAMISVDDRELFHLEIGRRLWRKLEGEELDRNIFVILTQIEKGNRLITRDKERLAVADLCLHAGRKAANLSAFQNASQYLNMGISLISDTAWKEHYDLMLSLHNAAAEMELCLSNFDRMDSILDSTFQNAVSYKHTLQATRTRIYSLTLRFRHQEAIDLAVKTLKQLGERIPSRIGRLQVYKEYRNVRRLLRGRSNDQLMRLPEIRDEFKTQVLHFYQLILIDCYLVKFELFPLVCLRMMTLTLTYGLSELASTAFAAYGTLHITMSGDIEEGFRFAEIGLDLFHRYGVLEYMPRVYTCVYGVLWSWKRPISDTLEPLMLAYNVGFQTGDNTFASMCATSYCYHAFDSGVPLPQIQREWARFREVMLSYKQEVILRMTLPTMQNIHHFIGLTKDPISWEGDLLDCRAAMEEARASENVGVEFEILFARTVQMVLFNEYEKAVDASRHIAKHYKTMPASIIWVLSFFYRGLVCAAMARKKGSCRRSNIRELRKLVKSLGEWSAASPHTVLERFSLLEAELYSVQGIASKAYEKYVVSISVAQRRGSLFIYALATEKAAWHFYECQDFTQAGTYFNEALAGYDAWGGAAKVEHLRKSLEGTAVSALIT